MDTRQIIEELGGSGQVSYITGVSRVTIWKWSERNLIPVRRWPVLIGQRLRKQKRELTLEDLYYATVCYKELSNAYLNLNKEKNCELE